MKRKKMSFILEMTAECVASTENRQFVFVMCVLQTHNSVCKGYEYIYMLFTWCLQALEH